MLSTTIRALDRTPKAFKDLDTCGQKISESDCNECHNLSCIGQYACASCLISHSMEARAMALAYSSSPLEHSQRFIWIRNEKWKYEKWLFSSWIYNFSQIFKWNLFHNFFFFAFLNESESHECTSEIRWHLNTEQVTHAHFFYFFVVDYDVHNPIFSVLQIANSFNSFIRWRCTSMIRHNDICHTMSHVWQINWMWEVPAHDVWIYAKYSRRVLSLIHLSALTAKIRRQRILPTINWILMDVVQH